MRSGINAYPLQLGGGPWNLTVPAAPGGDPDFINLGFEDAGVEPGEVDGWIITDVDTATVYAAFDTAPESSVEGFERWAEYLGEVDAASTYALMVTGGDGAIVGGTRRPFESFDSGWPGTDSFDLEPDELSTTYATFDEALDTFEAFEHYYLPNEEFVYDLINAALTDSETEGFSGWEHIYELEVTPSNPGVLETFEDVKPALIFTVDPATDLLHTAVAHGYTNGLAVHVSVSFGTLPAGLQAQNTYYVVEGDATSFKLFKVGDVAPTDITDLGSGIFTVIPIGFWPTRLVI